MFDVTLDIDSVAVARGGVPVLQDVRFSLTSGTALVLRGPNGIGKTTLLRAMAGLQPLLSGVVRGDEDQIAYAGHADGIKHTLTVTENLTFWAEIFGTQDITSALDAFHLHGLADRPAGELSAGQKRRLGLSRMLVTGRPIWIFDEPTVSLDAEAVGWFAAAVANHLETGGAALMATHIDLGLGSRAQTLDLAPFKASASVLDDFDEAFL